MRALAWVGGVLVLVVFTFGLWLSASSSPNATPSIAEARAALDPAARAPDQVRIRVRVLNSTEVSGLARRAMQVLRDHGYDVVDYRNAPTPVDTTRIELNPGATEHGERLRLAMGRGARIIQRETALPHIDVLITLGPDWKPPTQPFRP